jgi:hypothetical protein
LGISCASPGATPSSVKNGRSGPRGIGQTRAHHHAAALGQGPWGSTLRYGYEVRDQKEFFDDLPDVKIEPDMLKLAGFISQTESMCVNSLKITHQQN